MRLFLFVQAISFILLFSRAGAAQTEEESEHHGDHEAHADHEDDHDQHQEGNGEHHDADAPRFFAGAKASYLAAFHGHVLHLTGGGVFFEFLAVPKLLEIELFGRFMGGGDLIMFPIDIVFKVPFHINHTVHPFLGLGATVVPTSVEEETEVFFGGLVTAGSYFWLSSSFGIVAELNYNLVYEHGIVNEVGVNAGVVFGW